MRDEFTALRKKERRAGRREKPLLVPVINVTGMDNRDLIAF